jgi:hypothetical protein
MERYCALLRERLGEGLVESRGEVPEEVQEELVNGTYPLFLECGRQMSPQFRDESTI